jgi:hypothetical protein
MNCPICGGFICRGRRLAYVGRRGPWGSWVVVACAAVRR